MKMLLLFACSALFSTSSEDVKENSFFDEDPEMASRFETFLELQRSKNYLKKL